MQNRVHPLSGRILSRLSEAESEELNPWYCDDLRIARLTVAHAARGDAVLCSPQVLATYEVLGLHPDKVWPAIQARNEALGLLHPAPPKKPPQSVKLWCEKTNATRIASSRGAMQYGSPRTPISVPMAAPSLNALYPNPDGSESAKERHAFDEKELKEFFETCPPELVETRQLRTIESMWNAVGKAIGKKPTGSRIQFFLSINHYRTNRYRSASAVRYNLRRAERAGTLQVDYRDDLGRCHHIWVRPRTASDKGDYRRVPTYSLSIPLLLKWREWKRTGKLSSTPVPIRKPAQPDPNPPPLPPVHTAPLKRPAAEHQHRSTQTVGRDLRQALFNAYIALKNAGKTHDDALAEVVRQFSNRIAPEDVEFALKIVGHKNGRDVMAEAPPQQKQNFVPKCDKCGTALIQNAGPGPRLICPKCAT